MFNDLCLLRQRGGLTEENAERKRWNDAEQKKIMDSVQGIIITSVLL